MSDSSEEITTSSAPVRPERKGTVFTLVVSLIVGAVVALTVGNLSQQIANRLFPIPEMKPGDELRPGTGQMDPEEERKALQTVGVAGIGYFGAVAASALGVCGGLLRKAVPAAVIGLVAGVLFGGGAALAIQYANLNFIEQSFEENSPYTSLVTSALAFAVIGLVAGLVFAATESRRSIAKTAVCGAVGGALGGATYQILCMVALPGVNTDIAVPETQGARLLWAMLPMAFIALSAIELSEPKPVVRASADATATPSDS